MRLSDLPGGTTGGEKTVARNAGDGYHITLIAAKDMKSGVILAYVQANVPPTGALEHENVP